MQETNVMTREDIFEKIRAILEEALGVDEDEITLDASLTRDLEAESIDFLDIQFQIEKAFSTDDRPFKIQQGELFPENFMENAEWVRNGKFTDAGMTMIRERMPHVDFSSFEDRAVDKVSELFTVKGLVDFVETKLARA
ncbi:MAG: acyl carrier protein [Phycisphaerales bacterium]|nr:acyl carrier protein [Phycisphaerales bacterium]